MTVIVSAGGLTVHYAGLLSCDPCVSLKLCIVIHLKLTVQLLKHIMNTAQKRIEWWTQCCLKGTILLTFSKQIFQKKQDQTSRPYILLYCKFGVISNIGLKNKLSSVRLQNFIFVQWILAWDEAVKWSDTFCDSERMVECVPVCGDKSSIKFVSFHKKVNQNDPQHKYSLIVYWQFSFIQYFKNVYG